MSDGCRCEYLSDECNGADVVCQHCYDKMRKELAQAKTLLVDLMEASHHASEMSYLGEGIYDPWDKARAFLSANKRSSVSGPASGTE